MAEIIFDRVSKVYADGTRAVSDVELRVPDGSLAVLVGPSGCGKTTLLRMVAGLETVSSGKVLIDGRAVNHVPPKNRDIAMVFQNYALYPHMSVRDNMGFSLRLRGLRKPDIHSRVDSIASVLGLVDQLHKKPRDLSGGQRQRVAMGRAIVREPRAFLMDEPLSNLDAKLRVDVRTEIARLQRELGITMIYVTHDQVEAMTLGDEVAILRRGVLQQCDAPQDLYENPRNLFVAGFIGSPPMNLVEATLVRNSGLHVRFGGVEVPLRETVLSERPGLEAFVGEKVAIGVRPEDFKVIMAEDSVGKSVRLRAWVEMTEMLGREAYLHFSVDASPVVSDAARDLAADTDAIALEDLQHRATQHRTRVVAVVSARGVVREGDYAEFTVDPAALHFFDGASGEAIRA